MTPEQPVVIHKYDNMRDGADARAVENDPSFIINRTNTGGVIVSFPVKLIKEQPSNGLVQVRHKQEM